MFTTNLCDYDSFMEDALFYFSAEEPSDSPPDRVVSIIDAVTEEVIAVKKFYSTDEFTINVSPILKALYTPEVCTFGLGFVSSYVNSGYVKVYLRDGDGNESDPVLLVYSLGGYEDIHFVSSRDITEERTIYYAEKDFLRFQLLPNSTATVTLRHYMTGYEDYVAEKSYTSKLDATGATVFSLFACMLSGNTYPVYDYSLIERIEVLVSDAYGISLDPMNYNFVSTPQNVQRVAWLSSSGAIEHYTFENVVKSSRTSDGCMRKTLRSSPLNDDMRDFLSEIVMAEQVWAVNKLVYYKVTMLSDAVEIAPEGTLSSIEFEIEYKDE